MRVKSGPRRRSFFGFILFGTKPIVMMSKRNVFLFSENFRFLEVQAVELNCANGLVFARCPSKRPLQQALQKCVFESMIFLRIEKKS